MDFKINSPEEAKKFEELLRHYIFQCKSVHSTNVALFHLDKVYKGCQRYEDSQKYFVAYYDLAINITLTQYEIYSGIDIWAEYINSLPSNIDIHKLNVLENDDFFVMRLHFHRHLTAFITRYRASWDKIMGLYFLVFYPDQYDREFIKAPKKKKAFLKKFKGHKIVKKEICDFIENELSEFDEKYRTPEVHNTGALRKYTFGSGNLEEDNAMRIIIEKHYNTFSLLLPTILEIASFIMNLPKDYNAKKEFDVQ